MTLAPERTTYKFPNAGLEYGGVVMEDGWLSASQVRQYMACPECYYFERVKRVPRNVGIALPIGSGLHKGAEYLLRRVIANRTFSKADLIDAVEASVEHFDRETEARTDAESGVEIEYELGKYADFDAAKDDAARFAEVALPILGNLAIQRGVIETELEIGGLARPFPFPVVGRIDAVYGSWEDASPTGCSDIKTSSKSAAPDTFAAVQFGLYDLFWRRRGKRLRWYADVVVKGRAPSVNTYLMGEGGDGYVGDSESDRVREIVLDVADKICAGYFPPRPSFLCGYDHGFPRFTVAVNG